MHKFDPISRLCGFEQAGFPSLECSQPRSPLSGDPVPNIGVLHRNCTRARTTHTADNLHELHLV